MPCDHDKRCKVCRCCQECYPHAVGYWDESGIQGGCRDAHIRQQLEDFEVLESATGAILGRAQEAGNSANEDAARELIDQIARDRDRMLGTDDL